jgi:hypothetical protein
MRPTDLTNQAIGFFQRTIGPFAALPKQLLPLVVLGLETTPAMAAADSQCRSRKWHRGNAQDKQQDSIDQFVTHTTNSRQFRTPSRLILAPIHVRFVSRPPPS